MNFSTTVIIVCAALALGNTAPAACSSNRKATANTNAANANMSATPTRTPVTTSATPTSEPSEPQRPAEGGAMKVLAQGQYGKVEEPFLVVAREATVYRELRALVEGLPDVGADFFETQAVVAAFAGTRNTGGHGVEIKRGAGKTLVVEEKTPPKGAMTTMALTQPFVVVAVEVREEEGVEIDFDASRSSVRWRRYDVTSGDFTTGGGFAGRFEQLKLTGSLRIARLGKLLTLAPDLKGEGGTKPRALRGTATGIERDAANFEIPHLDPGTLVDHPRPAQRVNGTFAADAARLSLVFEPLPTNVNDGFEGRGKLEAKAAGPASPNK